MKKTKKNLPEGWALATPEQIRKGLPSLPPSEIAFIREMRDKYQERGLLPPGIDLAEALALLFNVIARKHITWH